MSGYTEMLERMRQVGLEEVSAAMEMALSVGGGEGHRVPVFGGMKAGKSSLLARLLSCEAAYLPLGVLEATARNVEIEYAFGACRKVVTASGEERVIESDAEWDDLVRGHVPELAQEDRLVLELPGDWLREESLSFLDTPGNNTSDELKAAETWQALSGISLGIYCLRSTAILTQTDLAFIQAAAYHLDNFIFLLTRVDEIGVDDVHDERMTELVEYTQGRLQELGIKPLALLPVSSKIEGDEASGLTAIRECVSRTLRQRGEELERAMLCKRLLHVVEDAAEEVSSSLALLAQAQEEPADEYRGRLADFQARLEAVEHEGRQSGRQLETLLTTRRLELRREILTLGTAAVRRLQSRMDSLTSGQELAEQGKALLTSELDRWRNEVSAAIGRFVSGQESLLQEASESFRASLSAAVASSVGVQLSVSLSVAEEAVDTSSLLSQCEELEQERQGLLKELESLRGEMAGDEEALPELRQNVSLLTEQLKGMKYEPQMVAQEVGGSGEMSEALGAIGSVLDFGLLLSPMPMSKLRWLSKIPGGKMLKKGVQYVNKVIRSKNKLLRKRFPLPAKSPKLPPTAPLPDPNPGSGFDWLDMFSCEGILSKVGEVLDGPRQMVMVEDPEVRQQYLEQVRPYKEEQQRLQGELMRREADLRYKQRRQETIVQGAQGLAETQEQLRREISEIERDIRKRNDERLLYEGRQQLLEQAFRLLAGPEAEVVRPILMLIDEQFAVVREHLGQELQVRQAKTVEELKEKMSEVEAALRSSAESRTARLEQLRRQEECLKAVLEQLSR